MFIRRLTIHFADLHIAQKQAQHIADIADEFRRLRAYLNHKPYLCISVPMVVDPAWPG